MNNKYDEKYKKIGINISKYRKIKGLKQEELANKVGISYSYIIQIEAPNVVKKMSLEVLFDIAEALEIDVKDLLQKGCVQVCAVYSLFLTQEIIPNEAKYDSAKVASIEKIFIKKH